MSGLMPPCMQTSVAPRAIASSTLPSTTSSAVGVRVGLPALALEGAELAVHEADVGEVDVAVDDVGDVVADVRRRGRRRRRATSAMQVVAVDARGASRPRRPSSVAVAPSTRVERWPRTAGAARGRARARAARRSSATVSIASQGSIQLMWDGLHRGGVAASSRGGSVDGGREARRRGSPAGRRTPGRSAGARPERVAGARRTSPRAPPRAATAPRGSRSRA